MDESLEQRPPYLWAGLVALGALLLYIVTLAPTSVGSGASAIDSVVAAWLTVCEWFPALAL